MQKFTITGYFYVDEIAETGKLAWYDAKEAESAPITVESIMEEFND